MPKLTTREAAVRLGVTVHQVRKLLHGGQLVGEEKQESRGKIWMVDADSVSKYATSPRKPGRPKQEGRG